MWASAGVLLLVPVLAAAQTAAAPGAGETDASGAGVLADYFGLQENCLSHYRFGSVTFLPETTENLRVFPGDTLRVRGRVKNGNPYPLPEGRILARVLREDPRVSGEHWHPVVAEHVLPGDYSLDGSGSAPFTFDWHVPARAPASVYRVEFHYLANKRFVFSGIPYVPNITGGSVLFEVKNGGLPAAVTFDRSSVRLNGAPLALRSVPPTLPAGSPVTIAANLLAEGAAEPIPMTLRTTLYAWSDTDLNPALAESAEKKQVAPGEPVAASFDWLVANPGTHEVVFEAIPDDPAILPSMMKVRFPVGGYVQRILYAGIGGYDENGNALVVTCATNGTVGTPDDPGTLALKVRSGPGMFHNASTETVGAEIRTSSVWVPSSALRSGIRMEAETRDANGEVTDRTHVQYSPRLLLGPDETSPVAPTEEKATSVTLWLIIALGAAVLGVLAFPLLGRKR